MKFYNNFSIITIVLLSACNIANNNFIEPRQYGIKFYISNRTDENFENTKVIIGGIDENEAFIPVDTYYLPKLWGSRNPEAQENGHSGVLLLLDGYDDIRWKPDFNTIKEIGDGKVYFKFQFNNEEATFLKTSKGINIFIDLFQRDGLVYDNYGNLRIYIGKLDEHGLDKDYLSGNTFDVNT